MVGMVVTISPSLSLYKMVVLPAASSPTMRIPDGMARRVRGGEAECERQKGKECKAEGTIKEGKNVSSTHVNYTCNHI